MDKCIDKRTNKLLQLLVTGYSEILENKLVGIYLHGSYAMGTYNRFISDLDYLVVTQNKLSLSEKRSLMDYTIDVLYPLAPKKGLEFHVLEVKSTMNSVFPMSFDLHYSDFHYSGYMKDKDNYLKVMHGEDEDLAAHIMITKVYGEVLIGLPINEVFGFVDKKVYLNSILSDIRDAKTDILDNPMYIILNLCRVLAFKVDNLVLSKKAGGEWAVEKLPERYRKLIKSALAEYEGKEKSTTIYRISELQKFATYMNELLF